MAWISKAAAAAIMLAATGNSAAQAVPATNAQAFDTTDSDSHWLLDIGAQCWAFDANGGPHDSIAWSGACNNGRIAGEGTLRFFDDGRLFETLAGKFDAGMLDDGHVSIAWSDGSRYDGEQQKGQFNGQGLLVAANGTRLEGQWKDDKLVAVVHPAAPAATRRATESAAGHPNNWALLTGSRATLISADGSKLSLSVGDGGVLARETVHPDGATAKTSLMLLSDRLGTLSDEKGEVVAIFHLNEQTLSIEYADGRTEVLSPNIDGGLTVTMQSPGASPVETSWYPEGHVFSSEPPPAPDTPAPGESAPKTASIPANAEVAIPKTKREQHSPTKRHAGHHVHPHSLNVSSESPPLITSPEPIIVRTSEVHPIDMALPDNNASDCLSVESNGTHWGFRNKCESDIQFAYCMKDGTDRLNACGESAAAGSVASHGFSALMADLNLADKNANHAFRWVGCAGGAGEVVARLDQYEPPMGRCLHESDLPPETERADASPQSRK